MNHGGTKVIATLGPSTRTEADVRRIKAKGVDLIRINMSHSSLEDLRHFIGLARKVGIPFIIDTEGSQVRTGELAESTIDLEENSEIRLYCEPIVGDRTRLSLKPGFVIDHLAEGDLIHIDFDTVILRVSDVSTRPKGYLVANTMTEGFIGRNKAVLIDPAYDKPIALPALSEKDYQSIAIGLEAGIEYIAASFMRSGAFVDEVRRATRGSMKVISKIECIDGLENLDEITDRSDFLLIDRGDLSKEVPIEKIPLLQKMILHHARKRGTGVFVATNLLETMITQRKPTRAEVHDVVNTLLDGATGLTLAAETAIGKHPMECINTLNKIIRHFHDTIDPKDFEEKESGVVAHLDASKYLYRHQSSALIRPHGGTLVQRTLSGVLDTEELAAMPRLSIEPNITMDLEQIAIGTYSPLEGFMGEADFHGVLNDMRLEGGLPWPLPIVLDATEADADRLAPGSDVALADQEGVVAILHLAEKFRFDPDRTAQKLYGTTDAAHPGVRVIQRLNPVLLGGKIDLVRKVVSEAQAYKLTPKQVRRLFVERGWEKVVGFHTRNVIHRSHEFLQLEAMASSHCDGLFVHPVVGKKKRGDFNAQYIIRSYELMMQRFYPRNRVVLAVFSTFSRYAGPREAVFTALCRKNFGCSHFIVGRDHTGVGDYYPPKAAHEIFDRLPDLGIEIVTFDRVFYSQKLDRYVHERDHPDHPDSDRLHISGTEARTMLQQGNPPPDWFMRPAISSMLIDALKNGEPVFTTE